MENRPKRTRAALQNVSKNPFSEVSGTRKQAGKRAVQTAGAVAVPSKRVALGELSNQNATKEALENEPKALKPSGTKTRRHAVIAKSGAANVFSGDQKGPSEVVSQKLSINVEEENVVSVRATRSSSAAGLAVQDGKAAAKLSASVRASKICSQESLVDLTEDSPESKNGEEPFRTTRLSTTAVEPSKDIASDHVVDLTEICPLESEKKVYPKVPNYVDVDKDSDYFHTPAYGADIFNYYKEREERFLLGDFLENQPNVTPMMRTILNDWLVEVQENFELNHEILYLASKITDQFLSLSVIDKEKLQLVGAAATLISCKCDERIPPLVDDFLYLCDDAYTREEFLAMERKILIVVDFELGLTISYRMLRRYGKCCQAAMDLLTLARYILETSLLHYQFAQKKESLMAASALWLAILMSETDKPWDATLIHYSTYEEIDLVDTAVELNNMLHLMDTPAYSHVSTVRNKYQHEVFYQVAHNRLLSEDELEMFVDDVRFHI